MHPGRPVWCVDVTHVERNRVVVYHYGCTENILRDLRAISDLAANLAPGALNTPRDIRADDRGLGSSGMVHPPTNSPAWDTADELIRWALALEGAVRTRLGHETTSHRQWHTLNDAIGYLLTYPTALLADPRTAEAIGNGIRRRKRALEQNTGRDRLIHRLPGTCMVCDRKGLQRPDGGELVKCRHCGATWAWESYERLSKAYAQDVRRRGA
jgi:ribosomal protein L37AE/L43A